MLPLASLVCLPLAVACGDSDQRQDGDGSSISSLGGETTADSGNSNSGNSSSNSTTNTGDGDGDDTGDGDGDADTGDGDADGGTGNHKWDVISIPDGNHQCGDGGGNGNSDFSYIWIANSSQGTMTKLNTDTMVEEGRYYMRPDGAGSPSRTTVSLSGNVAISARTSGGGVTKFWADIADCEESNGMPGIQTSSGANDILAWDMEECRAWHQPFVGKNYTSNRPMAWAPGELNEGTCLYENEKLWTSGSNGQTEVLLLDGETGEIEETINIAAVGAGYLYGGAVDGEGNFWGLQNSSKIIRVDRNDFTVQDWPVPSGPGYGIAIDAQSRVWTCGGGHASRFDPETETWQSTPGASSGIGGCMTDGEGTLYHSRYPQGVIVAIDTDTVAPVGEFVIPAYVHGISIDFKGMVWGVTFAGSSVYRLDPETALFDTYSGLVGAYTYSDMTGFGLSSVSSTPSG
ncbi:Methionine ABC transporter ATP-binding protein [Enhygromyxa salina]|uniref:Methionine ABC transporter ATP-binding protein n=1 Tax=Enhygromyxa salina TaxID=215803 RepID=A0A0C2CQ57_9BACT|nr:Methionine ABC transporter ATP-binding protein [Enhygromyxa salina]